MSKLLAVLSLMPALAGATGLAPFTAHYQAKVHGLSAEVVTTLTRTERGTYVIENRTEASGFARLARPRPLIERSEFIADDDGFRPVAFLSEDGTRRNKRGSTIDFDWSAASASAAYRGETREIGLEAGVLDRQLMQIALMQDLARGLTESEYTIIDRHDKRRYRITVLREESVDVPAGRYDALLIERKRPGSSRTSLMWCAPSLGYLTIKMQQFKEDKLIGELSLTKTG